MQFQDQLSEVIHALDEGSIDDTRILLRSMRAPELANLLESMPPKPRRLAWELLDEEVANQILQHLHEDVRGDFLNAMDTEQLLHAADELDTDDFADLLQQLPEEISQTLLSAMDTADRDRVEAVLSYPEDSAGGLMNTDHNGAATPLTRAGAEVLAAPARTAENDRLTDRGEQPRSTCWHFAAYQTPHLRPHSDRP